MSEVYEVTPVSCPACGADWTVPKSHRPGWGYVPTEGNYGHRTWECLTCGVTQHPDVVELRPKMS